MPRQPPAFRALGARERKPWARAPGTPDRRTRGRAGQRERQRVLDEEPFCRSCLERGLEVASDEVDHIVPLSEGGKDVRSNKQGLCVPCHRAKSLAEREAARRSSSLG